MAAITVSTTRSVQCVGPVQEHGSNALHVRAFSGLEDLDDKVADRLRNFLEPMWHAGGNDKDVTLGDAMRFATGDVRALPLSGRRHLTALHLAAKHECRLTVDDVEDIGLLVVHFDLAAGLAVTARH